MNHLPTEIPAPQRHIDLQSAAEVALHLHRPIRALLDLVEQEALLGDVSQETAQCCCALLRSRREAAHAMGDMHERDVFSKTLYGVLQLPTTSRESLAERFAAIRAAVEPYLILVDLPSVAHAQHDACAVLAPRWKNEQHGKGAINGHVLNNGFIVR